jgi:nucleotide-binding universal stress UspA family protein
VQVIWITNAESQLCMFQHILVPLDGSLRAEQALPVAARIARFTGGSLLLVQVVRLATDYSGGWAPAPVETQGEIDEEVDSAAAYLQAVATSPELSGIEIKAKVVFGLPVQQLLALVEAPEISLIVLCSHGRTGFTRWVLGSVAHALVHQATAPILVLRQSETPLSPASIGSGGPIHTLVPLDGSPLAEAALLPAAYVTAALATAGQGTMHLSQVVKIFSTSVEEGSVNELNEEVLQQTRTYLAQAQEHLSSEEKDLQLTLSHAIELAPDVASALLRLAEHGTIGKENDPFDLIAISTHGREGLQRWVMGSVTDRLLNTTKLPMLIVRPSKEG